MGSQGCEDAAELVARHCDGDESAFEEVIRRHYATVVRYATRRFKDASLAEDIAQVTFVRAMGRFDTFGPPYRVEAWLTTIASRVGVNMLRAQSRELPSEAVDLGADPSAEDRLAEYVEGAVVHEALDQVKPRHREVLELRIGGLSCPEIAVLLGEPKTTVQSRIKRAKDEFWLAYQGVVGQDGRQDGRSVGGLGLVSLLGGAAAFWRRARERVVQVVQGLADPTAQAVGVMMGVAVVVAPFTAADPGPGPPPRAQASLAQASEPASAAAPQAAGRGARLSVARSDAPALGASVATAGSEPAPERPSKVVVSGAAEVYTAGPGHPERERRREQARQWGFYHEHGDDWGVAADPDPEGTSRYGQETAEGTASGEGGAWAWGGAPVEYELHPAGPIEDG